MPLFAPTRRRRHAATAAPALRSWTALALALSTVAALVLGGCTSASARTGGPTSSGGSTSASSSSTSTTTTTTTLPAPVTVQGTAVPAEGFLGVVKRVPVIDVPPGRSWRPLPTAGTPGYLSIEQLAFRQFGSGPDLLLIMGQDGSMSWWEPSFLSSLAQHYRVTIFDLPGVGYSQPAIEPLTLGWLADETAGLIDSLGLVRPVVLGWGLGGEIALALAERHPAAARSLVLADTSFAGPGGVPPDPSVSARLDSPGASPTSLAGTLFSGPPAPSVSSSTSTSTSAGASGSAAAAESAWLSALASNVPDDLTRAVLANEASLQHRLWNESPLPDGITSLELPTLLVYGSDDEVFPPPNDDLLGRSINGARTVELPQAGYAAMFEDPAAFVNALEQFTG